MLAFLEGPDLWIVLVIVAVLFGANRLPKLARSLGEAQRELKKAMNDGAEETPSPAPPTPLPPPGTAPASTLPPPPPAGTGEPTTH